MASPASAPHRPDGDQDHHLEKVNQGTENSQAHETKALAVSANSQSFELKQNKARSLPADVQRPLQEAKEKHGQTSTVGGPGEVPAQNEVLNLACSPPADGQTVPLVPALRSANPTDTHPTDSRLPSPDNGLFFPQYPSSDEEGGQLLFSYEGDDSARQTHNEGADSQARPVYQRAQSPDGEREHSTDLDSHWFDAECSVHVDTVPFCDDECTNDALAAPVARDADGSTLHATDSQAGESVVDEHHTDYQVEPTLRVAVEEAFQLPSEDDRYDDDEEPEGTFLSPSDIKKIFSFVRNVDQCERITEEELEEKIVATFSGLPHLRRHVSALLARNGPDILPVQLWTAQFSNFHKPIFSKLNQRLRQYAKANESLADTWWYLSYFARTLAYLAPLVTGTVWHAGNMKLPQNAKTFCQPCFTSCCATETAAVKHFLRGGDVMYEIRGAVGYSLKNLSGRPEEDEVLMVPFAEFCVVEVIEKSDTQPYTKVILQMKDQGKLADYMCELQQGEGNGEDGQTPDFSAPTPSVQLYPNSNPNNTYAVNDTTTYPCTVSEVSDEASSRNLPTNLPTCNLSQRQQLTGFNQVQWNPQPHLRRGQNDLVTTHLTQCTDEDFTLSFGETTEQLFRIEECERDDAANHYTPPVLPGQPSHKRQRRDSAEEVVPGVSNPQTPNSKKQCQHDGHPTYQHQVYPKSYDTGGPGPRPGGSLVQMQVSITNQFLGCAHEPMQPHLYMHQEASTDLKDVYDRGHGT
eukprot:TRINITY_DN61583_c0_g2_i1.p1 TRINITY_DN61583_c0_g2~~TRINITY_DN61583_c0_g2_i1.p1  ORF type:complete len:748 (+),score=51.14 TRINITY_DN61583_c0_g2_i1:34-2277(+)